MKLKKIISLSLSLIMAVSSVNLAFANNDNVWSEQENATESKYEYLNAGNDDILNMEQKKDTSVQPMATHDTIYQVKGGYIYFDSSTGTITYADTSITSAIIPKQINGVSVIGIGNRAFEGCRSLTSITIPSSVSSIGEYAFSGCSGLTSITIPGSVTSIGNYGFKYCISLKNVTIENGVTNIGNYAFVDCRSLTSITIPSSVTGIGNRAFEGCRSLTSITIPNSVTGIGDYAFNSCSSLIDITIPSSVTSIGEYAFSDCRGLTSITIPGSVTSIGNYGFTYCSSLKNVTIENGVTGIGNYAFYDCSSLTSITIPSSVTDIGDYAFSYCSGLESITIPSSVTSIGKYAFSYCSGLESITIPSSVTGIGDGAFFGCSSITSITIPGSVTSIGNDGFRYCSSLKNVAIENGVTSIGNCAFEYCSSLTDITIPSSVTSIGNSAFVYCSSLKNVAIENGVTSIGNCAFEHCSSLTDITIPSSVTSIGNDAFEYCSSLTGITIPSGVTSIGRYAFSNCSSLTGITISTSVTGIGDHAFSDCSSLTDIIIPNSVTSIGYAAFSGCSSLTGITIPSGVTGIGNYAFSDCSNLKDVYYSGSENDWNKISIGSDNEELLNATIHYNCKDTSTIEIGHTYRIIRYDDLLGDDYTYCDESDISYLNHVLGHENSWVGKLVLAELETNVYPNIIYKADLINIAKGTVSDVSNDTAVIDGVTYKLWEVSDAEFYKGSEVIYYTYGKYLVDISLLNNDSQHFFKLESYDSDYNTINVKNGNSYYKLYINFACTVSSEEIANMVGSYVQLVYDDYMDVYNIVKTDYVPDEIKIPSGDYGNGNQKNEEGQDNVSAKDIIGYANEWISAIEDYFNGSEAVLESAKNDELLKENKRFAGALKLMEDDIASDSKYITGFSELPKSEWIYAYEALYDMLDDMREKSALDLGSIKNVGKAAQKIVEKVSESFYSYNTSNSYGKYNVTINATYTNFGYEAYFGSMTVKLNGATVETLVLCSTDEILTKAVEAYLNELLKLEKNALSDVVTAVVKDLSGKNIDDWCKLAMKNKIKSWTEKYASQFILMGVGEFANTIYNGSTIYSRVKALSKSIDKSGEKQYKAVKDLYETANTVLFDDTTITDKAVKKLYSEITSTFDKLKNNCYAYLNNTYMDDKDEEGGFFNWFASVKCPVDVYVYDKQGNQVGYIVGNEVYYEDEIKLIKNDDVKNIYLPDIGEYDIKIVATDSGTLNYVVEQFENDVAVGRANFYNVKLYTGKELNCVADSVTDISTQYENITLKSDGESIKADEFISSDEYAVVNIYEQSTQGGSILGCGSYVKGDGVNLNVLIDDGYIFTGWFINDKLISNEKTCSFTAVEDLVVEAKFKKKLYDISVVDYKSGIDCLLINANYKNNNDDYISDVLYAAVYDSNYNLKNVASDVVGAEINEDYEVGLSVDCIAENGDIIMLYILDENEKTVAKALVEIKDLQEYIDDSEPIYGDSSADGTLTANDAAIVLKKVLNNSYAMPIEEKVNDYFKYVDANNDGVLTAADSTVIIQKVLNSEFKMLCEK